MIDEILDNHSVLFVIGFYKLRVFVLLFLRSWWLTIHAFCYFNPCFLYLLAQAFGSLLFMPFFNMPKTTVKKKTLKHARRAFAKYRWEKRMLKNNFMNIEPWDDPLLKLLAFFSGWKRDGGKGKSMMCEHVFFSCFVFLINLGNSISMLYFFPFGVLFCCVVTQKFSDKIRHSYWLMWLCTWDMSLTCSLYIWPFERSLG